MKPPPEQEKQLILLVPQSLSKPHQPKKIKMVKTRSQYHFPMPRKWETISLVSPPPDKKQLKLMIMESNKLPTDMLSSQSSKPQKQENPMLPKKLQLIEKLTVKPSVMPLKLFKNNKRDKTLTLTEKTGPLVCQPTLLMEITKPQFSRTPPCTHKRNEEIHHHILIFKNLFRENLVIDLNLIIIFNELLYIDSHNVGVLGFWGINI